MNSKTINLSPKAWFQSGSGWYVEGRYNFEAAKTMSVITGKTFAHQAAFSYDITPLAGIVTGKYNGGAIAVNGSMGYSNFYLSLQTQYTFSIENRDMDFLYNWADLCYDLFHGLSAGMSVQTNLYQGNGKSEMGFFLKAGRGKWQFPVYVFNAGGKNRYVILGLNYTYR